MKVLVGTEYDIRHNFIDSFIHAGKAYVVYSHGKRIYIFDAKCPHAHGDLRQAAYEGHSVVCPSHGLRFDLESGDVDINDIKDDFRDGIVARGGDRLRLRLLPHETVDGEVFVEID